MKLSEAQEMHFFKLSKCLFLHVLQSSKQPKRPDCQLLTSLLDMLVKHLQQACSAQWPFVLLHICGVLLCSVAAWAEYTARW